MKGCEAVCFGHKIQERVWAFCHGNNRGGSRLRSPAESLIDSESNKHATQHCDPESRICWITFPDWTAVVLELLLFTSTRVHLKRETFESFHQLSFATLCLSTDVSWILSLLLLSRISCFVSVAASEQMHPQRKTPLKSKMPSAAAATLTEGAPGFSHTHTFVHRRFWEVCCREMTVKPLYLHLALPKITAVCPPPPSLQLLSSINTTVMYSTCMSLCVPKTVKANN